MHKVLIADASEQWRELLEQALEKDYLVRSGTDGRRTLELAQELRPDVLVIDLLLSGVDGLTILKKLDELGIRPRTIVTGKYFSNFITAALERYQVDDLIMKPCTVAAVTDRVAQVLAQEEKAPVLEQDPYDAITAMLVELGAPTSQQGFRFLRSGIMLLMEDPAQQLTKSLYPAIAAEFGTNKENVEKGLRTTVTTAWTKRRDNVWRAYFPPAPNGQIPRPTAGQFMVRLTDVLLSVRRRRA